MVFSVSCYAQRTLKKVSFGGLRGCPGVVKNSKKHLVFDWFGKGVCQRRRAKRHWKILYFLMFFFTRFWASGSPSNRPEVPLTRPLSRETRASKRVFLGPSSFAQPLKFWHFGKTTRRRAQFLLFKPNVCFVEAKGSFSREIRFSWFWCFLRKH